MRRVTCCVSLEWLLLILIALCGSMTTTRAFSPHSSIMNHEGIIPSQQQQQQHYHGCYGYYMTADDFSVSDGNDKPITVGTIVRVVAKGLQAHQVPAKAYGKFDEDGNFCPSPSAATLEVPIGLTGRVTKLYNKAELSANFPIQVKFDTEENEKEWMKPPVPFVMHFLPTEVECVVE